MILFAVGIAVYVKRNQADVYITEAWISSGDDTKSSLQAAFMCCGFTMFNASVEDGGGIYTWPCDKPDQGATMACKSIMLDSFQSHYQTAGGCGIAFSCIMVISLAITAYLMVGIRESAVNQAIEKNRARNERDMQKNRRKGKGLKIPQVGPGVL